MRIAAILLGASLLAGCGYTLQGKADLPFESIVIGTIRNETVEPKLQDRLHRQLADTLLRNGFEVRSAAPHRIDGSIIRFDMAPISERALVAVEYQITVVSKFTLTDVRTGKTEILSDVTSPFSVYFRSTDRLENVLARKELASEGALRDLSDELVRRIIYEKMRPKAPASSVAPAPAPPAAPPVPVP